MNDCCAKSCCFVRQAGCFPSYGCGAHQTRLKSSLGSSVLFTESPMNSVQPAYCHLFTALDFMSALYTMERQEW